MIDYCIAGPWIARLQKSVVQREPLKTTDKRIADFEANVDHKLIRFVHELQTRMYRPQPVRRVTLPKPGGGEAAVREI